MTPEFLLATTLAAVSLSPADDATIRDLESRSWVAWKAQDAAFFDQFLSDDHVEVHGYGVTTKASVVDAVRRAGCVVQAYALGPLTLTHVALCEALGQVAQRVVSANTGLIARLR